MDSLKKADELLTVATRLLDEVAEIYAATDLPERTEQISRIGNSLASAFSVQQAIYERLPELTPHWLKEPSPHSEENREYGKLLISINELWKNGRNSEALEQLRSYLSVERPPMFREMAERQVEILEKSLRGNVPPNSP